MSKSNGVATAPKTSKKPVSAAVPSAANPSDLDIDDLETPAATTTAEAPKGKPKKEAKAPAPKADEPPPEEATEPQFKFAPNMEVYDVPLDELKPNPCRANPTPEHIQELAKSIRSTGLQNPIVIGSDMIVISGNTRLAAYKALGRKTIPARLGVNTKGEQIASTEVPGILANLVENLQRTNLTPVEMSRFFNQAIKAGVAKDAKDLASKIGIPASTVVHAMSISEKGSKKLLAALEEGKVTREAVIVLIHRSKDHDEQDRYLEILLKASDGKIGIEDVNEAVPAGSKSKAKGNKKGGRPPSRSAVSPDKLNAPESMTAVTLVRGSTKGKVAIEVNIRIDHEGDDFARFDLARRVQAAVQKIDPKSAREGLNEALERLK